MKSLFFFAVLLLAFLANVNTQTTTMSACVEKEDTTNAGVKYQIKCGKCANLTTTSTRDAQGGSFTAMCNNCTAGTAGPNKTCNYKTSDTGNSAFLTACSDYSSTCSSAYLALLSGAMVTLASLFISY